MLLTNGNIKTKSKILQYHFYFSKDKKLENDEYINFLITYHKTIENDEFAEYIKIEKYLHDSTVKIFNKNKSIIIEFNYWKNDENRVCTGELEFLDATLMSWNKVIKSGHISRLNKNITPCEYGYDEFYKHNNEKYVTIIFFTKDKNQRVNTGIYYPMLTIKYKWIKVNEEKNV